MNREQSAMPAPLKSMALLNTGTLQLQLQSATDWTEALAAAVQFDSKDLPMRLWL